MTQPTAANSKLLDKSDNPQIGDQLAAITAAVAITNYTALTNLTDPVTKAEGEAISAALSQLEDEVTLLQVAVNLLIERMETQGLIADN